MDRVNWERRVLLLAEELGRSERHPQGHDEAPVTRPSRQGPAGVNWTPEGKRTGGRNGSINNRLT